MGQTRRAALASFFASALMAADRQNPDGQDRNLPLPPNPNEDVKLPNGKSQKDAIAKQDHEQALKDTNELIGIAQQLREELEKAGNYVVPMSSVKKTEEIEKLARRIRGKLKD